MALPVNVVSTLVKGFNMKYLPVFTDLNQQLVLVIGGGDIALRKVRLLHAAGAQIKIISRQFDPELQAMASDDPQIKLVQKTFHDNDLLDEQPPILVIAATDDQQLNQQIAALSKQHNILFNAVDAPAISTFIFPAIVDRSPIVVAISSGGDAPVLARRLREKLETLLPMHLASLGNLMGRFRAKVKAQFASINQRRSFWEQVLSSSVVSLLSQNRHIEAETELNKQLDNQSTNHATPVQAKGEVYIVGGGPGDPDLLTIKALQLMQQADIVVHDGLISEQVLNLVRRDADRVNVSKSATHHSVPQEQINQMLIDYARQGHKVCRLKGGDPFIFGRGGEEVEALIAADINYQIVPGITAAAGCSAYAGIPLTHRDHAQTIQFVTGHCRKNGTEPDWRSLAQSQQTLVIYMGLINSGTIASQLIAHGRATNTPVALIEHGTLHQQRVITGQLHQLNTLIQQHQIQSPALIIIGEVVSLHSQFQWFAQQANLTNLTSSDNAPNQTLAQTTAYSQPLVDLNLDVPSSNQTTFKQNAHQTRKAT